MSNIDLLNNSATAFGINLSSQQLKKFDLYYELLIEWNEKINLTAITDYDEVVIKHFLDSISIIKYISFHPDSYVLDVGTGAGFPGIPLKILFPDMRLVLLDSLNKRINFLNCVIDNLNLNKVKTVHGRAEDLAKDTLYREQFDFVVSRAVANLSSLSELCLPFVKVGSEFISYKSEKANDEILSANQAIQKLGGKIQNCFHFNLPGTDYERNLVCIEKIMKTPLKYPRKAGTPLKKPL